MTAVAASPATTSARSHSREKRDATATVADASILLVWLMAILAGNQVYS
jgi:hypothetical protein